MHRFIIQRLTLIFATRILFTYSGLIKSRDDLDACGFLPFAAQVDFPVKYERRFIPLPHPRRFHMFASRNFIIQAALLLLLGSFASADDWPQWRGPKRDGVWRETGIVEKFAEKQLPIKWRAEVGPGYSGPTVAGERVFLTDRQTKPKQTERVHAFDAAEGKKLWTFEYDCEYKGVGYEAGPRACVTIDEDRAFALGSMGHLHCLNISDGSVIWKKDCNTEYHIRMPIWGIASAPLVYENLVIVQISGEHACLVAFEKATGKEAWKALDDRANYSAPIINQHFGRDNRVRQD